MKKIIAFTIADDNNLPYAEMMIRSLRKFHSEEELPIKIYGSKEIAGYGDRNFFYRATPIIGAELLKEYETVIKLDADQIITGSLDHIINSDGYDVGVVYNWNEVDPRVYGEVYVLTVDPKIYFNAGFVVMKSQSFVNQWLKLCNSYHFDRLRYREQDLMNILCHYGDYNVKCFDDPDKVNQVMAWHGLRNKGGWGDMVVKDDKLMLGNIEIKVLHWGGGNDVKMNYRVYFNEEVISYLDKLVS